MKAKKIQKYPLLRSFEFNQLINWQFDIKMIWAEPLIFLLKKVKSKEVKRTTILNKYEITM